MKTSVGDEHPDAGKQAERQKLFSPVRIPGLAYMHKENAYVIERDVSVLRNTIEELYFDKELRDSLIISQEERRQLYEQFNYDRLAQELINNVFEVQVYA